MQTTQATRPKYAPGDWVRILWDGQLVQARVRSVCNHVEQWRYCLDLGNLSTWVYEQEIG